MGDVRRDPIVYNRISIISPTRGLRPKELTVVRHEVSNSSKCPFCQGNEDMTPPATLVLRYEGGNLKLLRDDPDYRVRDWLIRIVPNKYPIFTKEGSNGYGYHEVVIEHPRHDISIYDMAIEHLGLVFFAVFHRAKELYNDPTIRHVYLFKNFGGGGGASLPHPHMQLVATSVTLPSVIEELKYSKILYAKLGSCPYCELVRREVRSLRLVYMNKEFVVVTSYAPRHPYEAWILPLKHSLDPLELCNEEEILSFADALGKLMIAYKKCLGSVDFNFWLHMSPKGGRYSEYYHWHLEVLPVTTPWGGLEKGGNVYVVTLSPEEAARELRSSLSIN
ncbi:MAG: DUF4931 domain-containing protein [Sulfolobales archaeon]